jgi:hypothetical protein
MTDKYCNCLSTIMQDTSHIHVRPLEIGDFDFVRELASKQRNFTVPPVYVLWLMLRIKGAICLVAEHSARGLLGYLIAVPIEAPTDSMFIWQFAVLKGQNRAKAASSILIEFRKILSDLSIRNLCFSSVPHSAVFRTLRGYAREVFTAVPGALSVLPPGVNGEETEFLLNLSGVDRGVKR